MIENSPGGIQAKHGKSEILYAVPVESCRGNGRHVQGDGMIEELGKVCGIISVKNIQ